MLGDFDFHHRVRKDILAANLIATHVTVCFESVLFQVPEKDWLCVYVSAWIPLARKSAICLFQQQMLCINYALKSLENNFLNGKMQGGEKSICVI